MNTFVRKPALVLAALCLGGTSPCVSADEGWDWVVAPYVWAATIGADLETTEPPSFDLSGERSFDDVIDKLDGAFQIHAEGQNDQFGFFADFTFLGLADEKDRPTFRTETDLDTRLFELAGVWSPGPERYRGWDVFAGLRHIDVDFTMQLEPVNPAFAGGAVDVSETFNDFMVGARYHMDLSERWGATLRADSSFGDTDGTWNASAVAQYRTRRGAWLIGYRHLSVSLQPRSGDIEISMSGPMLGYAMQF